MSEIDEQLDYIRELEAVNNNISRWNINRGYIAKTARESKLITIDEHLESKTLKPDKIGDIIGGIFILFLSAAAVIQINSVELNIIVSILLVSIFIGVIIAKNKTRPDNIITLSREGIAYDETLYKWANIKETAYLHLPVGGKKNKTFLVLLFNNNEYDIWELTNYRSFYPSFTTKLANYIDHFKPTPLPLKGE